MSALPVPTCAAAERQELLSNTALIEEGGVAAPCTKGVTGAASGSQRLPRRSRLLIMALGVPTLLVAVLGVAAKLEQPQGSRAADADVSDSVGLAGGLELLGALAESIGTAAKLVKDTQKSTKDVKATWSALQKPGVEARKEVLAEKLPDNVTEHLLGLKGAKLFPRRNGMQDGSNCPADEEEFQQLCYKKCSDLTGGHYPIRTTAFACCMERPCSFYNTKFTNPLKLCQGLDVSGRREGSECPHMPGDCLRNEELSVGHCYMKCALLTANNYPFRSGASECCRYQNHLACLDPLNKVISANFTVGGGMGDDQLEDAMGAPHAPVPALAEVQTTTMLIAPLPR
jgi:hypothetical protein